MINNAYANEVMALLFKCEAVPLVLGLGSRVGSVLGEAVPPVLGLGSWVGFVLGSGQISSFGLGSALKVHFVCLSNFWHWSWIHLA